MPSRPAGLVLALVAALFFGASVPASKHFGLGMNFLMVGALLYLGSGLGLGLTLLARRCVSGSWGAGIARGDWPLLVASSLLGGAVAPACLMWGLARTSGIASSLMGSSEAVFTALLAWFFFKEKIGRLAALALALVVAGGLLLAWPDQAATGNTVSTPAGLAAITAAYLGWGLDNNLTRKLSHNDPLLTAGLRGIGCGTLMLLLAHFAGGAPMPGGEACLKLGLTGALGYGISLSCLILSMRTLGAARSGAAFGAAPFFGAVAAMAWLGEHGSWMMGGAAALMAGGIALLGWESSREKA